MSVYASAPQIHVGASAAHVQGYAPAPAYQQVPLYAQDPGAKGAELAGVHNLEK